jgi:hypothetical protein
LLGKSLVARDNQWSLLKSLVAKVVNLLLWKASGCYGEVMAVVESQRPLGKVNSCWWKSLIVTDSHWMLKQSMVTMGSHCMLCETLVGVGSRWLQR